MKNVLLLLQKFGIEQKSARTMIAVSGGDIRKCMSKCLVDIQVKETGSGPCDRELQERGERKILSNK